MTKNPFLPSPGLLWLDDSDEVIHLHVPQQIPCSRAPHVAMGRGLYHHPMRLASEPGVQSLRVPISRSAFPADCPHLEIVTALGTRGSSEFPAYSQVCSGSLRIRSRNTVYDLALLAEPRF